MNQEEVLERLELGMDDRVTAGMLLDEKMPRIRARFRSAVKALNQIMSEVQKEFPNAGYYLQEDTLNLMLGDSHDGNTCAQPELVAENVLMLNASGGGW